MKKTNTRVRRNSSKKTAIPQAPTTPDTASPSQGTAGKKSASKTRAAKAIHDAVREMELRAGDSVTLALTGPDGAEFARVDLSSPLFGWLEKAARAQGVGVTEFIEQAAREKLQRETSSGLDSQAAATGVASAEEHKNFRIAAESEEAALQTHALMRLIVETMDGQNFHAGHWEEEFGNKMWAGIHQLTEQSAERLHRAAAAVGEMAGHSAGLNGGKESAPKGGMR